MRKHFIRLAAAGGAAVALLAPTAAGAVTAQTGMFQNIETAVNVIVKTIVAVAGTVFIIMLVVGGIRYLSSAGNEEEVGKAKKLLIDAIVGLIITLAAYAIGMYVVGALGTNAPTTL